MQVNQDKYESEILSLSRELAKAEKKTSLACLINLFPNRGSGETTKKERFKGHHRGDKGRKQLKKQDNDSLEPAKNW